jgi:hypothetical protein
MWVWQSVAVAAMIAVIAFAYFAFLPKRRIMKAFENIRHHLPAPPQPPPQEPQVKTVYTDHHEAHFRARAKHLTLAALPSSHIGKTPRGDGSEIVVPTEGAEQLIAEAIRRFK